MRNEVPIEVPTVLSHRTVSINRLEWYITLVPFARERDSSLKVCGGGGRWAVLFTALTPHPRLWSSECIGDIHDTMEGAKSYQLDKIWIKTMAYPIYLI